MKALTKTAILASALFLALTACGKTEAENTKTAETNEVSPMITDTEAVTEDSALKVPDNLPDTDLGGYEYRILTTLQTHQDSVYMEEETGSIVGDAVYRKIRTVEERFNCDITAYEADSQNSLTKPILAGDDVYDIGGEHDVTLANATLSGYFMNLYDVPYLDFTQPWWPEFTVKSLSVGQQMYLISNYISYYNMRDTRVMYFNKTLLSQLDIEYPYEMVKNHTWTLDYMISICKDAYQDLNGNGVRDLGDRFGISNNNYYYCVLEPFGNEPYQHDADGNLFYQFDVEFYQPLVEKLFALFYDGGYVSTGTVVEDLPFVQGESLFMYENLDTAFRILSGTDISYGILPMPLFDESQKDYAAGCTDRPFAIPITADGHMEETGLITEALSAEGYRQVYPAYFELALKSRYADQNEDAQMIDIIMSNNILSFTYMYGDFNSPYSAMLANLFPRKSTDVASYAAKREKSQINRVKIIEKGYQKMLEN